MEPDPLPWLILGIALVLLICVNALEVAYAFVHRSEVKRRLESGMRKAQLVDRLLQDTTPLFLSLSIIKYISVLLIGAVSALFVLTAGSRWQMIGSVVFGWFLFALLQPAWRAAMMRRATELAFALSPMMVVILTLFRPLTFLIQQVNQWAAGDVIRNDEHAPFSDEALRLFVSNNEGKEEIEENEREMIVSILEMNETSAREIMVPRIDMVTLSVETPLRDALDTIINAGHSRIPVYEENVDTIVGMLYAKDLLQCFRDNQTERPIRELLRSAYFVPASKKVDALFQEMQLQRVHMALVVDEYGGTAGLVSIEDILEEIVGEIQDEYDAEEDVYVQAIGPDTYLLNSRLDIYSLTKLLDIEIDTDSADTLGGLLYTLMEHVPEQGESVDYGGWNFTVLALDGRRIEQVRAELFQPVLDTPMEPATAPEQAGMQRSNATQRSSFANVQAVDS